MNAPQTQKYVNILRNVVKTGFSIPILCSNFKTVEFTIICFATITYDTLAGGNFDVGDTITQTSGAGTGTTGIVVSDDGVGSMTVQTIVPAGGGFNVGETIDNGSGVTANTVTLDLPDFDITVTESNGGVDEFTPPDPTQPVTNTNQYSDVEFQDKSTLVSYNETSPYNPSAEGTMSRTFQVQTNGSRWIFVEVSNWVSGSVSRSDMDLFSIL